MPFKCVQFLLQKRHICPKQMSFPNRCLPSIQLHTEEVMNNVCQNKLLHQASTNHEIKESGASLEPKGEALEDVGAQNACTYS